MFFSSLRELTILGLFVVYVKQDKEKTRERKDQRKWATPLHSCITMTYNTPQPSQRTTVGWKSSAHADPHLWVRECASVCWLTRHVSDVLNRAVEVCENAPVPIRVCVSVCTLVVHTCKT